jgi:FkbM family methyltransferase
VTGLIYDFGMYNGDDVEYYLKKGYSVVAVEANPKFCAICEHRFAEHIKGGRLSVLNVALSAETSGDVDFYVHKTHPVWSQLTAPSRELNEYQVIKVPQRKASAIVEEYGMPHYIKIDIEHMDAIILGDLFGAGIKPDFISAEAHSIRVFATLVTGGYSCFNLVDGPTVGSTYRNALIETTDKPILHTFKDHSAGPYGEDIKSPWLDADSFFYLLASEGLGWKDIHASKTIRPVSGRPKKTLSFTQHLSDLGPSLRRAAKFRLGLMKMARHDRGVAFGDVKSR